MWNEVIQRVGKKKDLKTSLEIAVLGNINVGKTSLILKLVSPEAVLQVEKIKTHGTDIKSIYISICG